MMCMDCAARLIDAAGVLADVAMDAVEALEGVLGRIEAGDQVAADELRALREEIQGWQAEMQAAADVAEIVVGGHVVEGGSQTWH